MAAIKTLRDYYLIVEHRADGQSVFYVTTRTKTLKGEIPCFLDSWGFQTKEEAEDQIEKQIILLKNKQ